MKSSTEMVVHGRRELWRGGAGETECHFGKRPSLGRWSGLGFQKCVTEEEEYNSPQEVMPTFPLASKEIDMTRKAQQ